MIGAIAMEWIDRIFGNYVPGRGAAGLLIVRLVFGLGIMLHGWQKIQSPGGPAGWMNPPPAATGGTHADGKHEDKEPEKKAAPRQVPAFFQALATMAEFSGGLGIIVGLLTPLASLGLICNMLVALFMVHLPQSHPFVGAPGQHSYEPAAGYLAVALLLLLTGPGAWSLDAWLVGRIFRRPASAGPTG
jgi:putative oxidoreductase